jgi:hypothetical protein
MIRQNQVLMARRRTRTMCRVRRETQAQVAFMLTNATARFLQGHEADECDCPACLPPCEQTGKRCFIRCDRCKGKIEADDIGPLKSLTKRVHYTLDTSKPKLLDVGPETKFIRLLKSIED